MIGESAPPKTPSPRVLSSLENFRNFKEPRLAFLEDFFLYDR